MSTYRIAWDNGHSCGTLPGDYTNKRVAESAARAWKREMVAIEPTPEARREARETYQWEIIDGA